MPTNSEYINGSVIPNKAVKLVAAVHQSMQAKLLRKFMNSFSINRTWVVSLVCA